MASNDWTSIRLRQGTRDRLQAFADTLARQAETKARDRQPAFLEGKISLADALDVLLWRNDQHAARSSSANQRRKQRKKLVGSSESGG